MERANGAAAGLALEGAGVSDMHFTKKESGPKRICGEFGYTKNRRYLEKQRGSCYAQKFRMATLNLVCAFSKVVNTAEYAQMRPAKKVAR